MNRLDRLLVFYCVYCIVLQHGKVELASVLNCREGQVGPSAAFTRNRDALLGFRLSPANGINDAKRCGQCSEGHLTMEHINSDLMLWYWNSLRKGRIAPNQSDIDPRAISKVLATVFILDASIPSQPTYRLAGTQLCAWFGSELKGKSFLAHWDANASETLAWLLHRGMRLHLPLCIHSLCSSGNSRVALETTLAPIGAGASEPTRFIGLAQTLGAEMEIGGMNFAFQQLSDARLCDADLAAAPKLSSSHLALDRYSPSDDAEPLRWLRA